MSEIGVLFDVLCWLFLAGCLGLGLLCALGTLVTGLARRLGHSEVWGRLSGRLPPKTP